MSRIIVDSIRNSSASSDGITLSSDGKVAFPNTSTGKIIQVVQTVKTDVTSVSVNGGSFGNTDSSFGITITPSSTSSLIYLNGFVNVAVSGGTKAININYRRGGADLTTAVDGSSTIAPIGDAAGSRKRIAANGYNTDDAATCFPIALLDKPASTSAQTYSLSLSHGSGSSKTMYINMVNGDSDNSGYHRACSVFIAMEVAA